MNTMRQVRWEDPCLEIGMQSIIGTRQSQQDFVYLASDEECTLAAVCDGMGGMEAGERASRKAVEILGSAFLSRDKSLPIPDFFLSQAEAMNQGVCSLLGEGGKRLRAGTTIAAAAIQSGRLYWLSIGDSRLYILRDGRMQQINRGHNYRLTLKESLKSGVISREQYEREEHSRQAEALISYLGINRLTLMDRNLVPFEMQKEDIVLLCSDGLYKSLTDSQIQALIEDNAFDPMIAADRLCAMALSRGGGIQDNTSVLILRYQPTEKGRANSCGA